MAPLIDICNSREFNSKIIIPPLDVLFCGATGAGKSTTLNCIAQDEAATVGYGCIPETHTITPYRLSKTLRCWDTPGLGDSPQIDENTILSISSKLLERCSTSSGNSIKLIDMLVIIVNGSTRDLSVIYTIIDKFVPLIGTSRASIVVNQADMAMYGRHWDYEKCNPDDTLKKFIHENEASILRRIKEETGICLSKIVSYSAKYRYNITGLYSLILSSIPTSIRK